MTDDLLIVGIGASAGGLRAIEQFFDSMPADSGAAFVVVQHLSPDHRSLMQELLSRRTSMSVKRVTEGIEVAPNTIFLIPPGQNLVFDEGKLRLAAQDREAGHEIHFPIDLFFHSLANGAKERAVCIVLSGTGSDGSRGIQQVAEMGGIVLAQAPETAEFDGMPHSAIATNIVDLILPPAELALATHQLVCSSEKRKALKSEVLAQIGSAQLQQIIDIVERYHKLDFSHYKPSTISRRVHRRCLIAGYSSLDRYVSQLANSEAERAHLCSDLLINVTRFFRDRDAWQHLKERVFPGLIDSAIRASEPLRLWVTACSTGEEAYSIAMLLTELLEVQQRHVDVKIFATDIAPAALERAAAGVYPAAIVRDLSAERLKRFFVRKEEGFQVSRSLRKMIIFANHNLTKDTSFTNMHFVSCRNVLIYMQSDLQMNVLRNLHFALRTNGILFLGPSESLGSIDAEFETLQRKWKLYRKLRNVRLPMTYKGLSALTVKKTQLMPAPQQRQRFDPLLAAAFKSLLSDRQATCFLVDRHNQLLYMCGDLLHLLTMPEGRMSGDIVPMLHPSLQLPVSTALHSALHRKARIRYGSCRVECLPGEDWTDLHVGADSADLEIVVSKQISADQTFSKQVAADQAGHKQVVFNQTAKAASPVDSPSAPQAASSAQPDATPALTVSIEVSFQPTSATSGEFLMVMIEKETAFQTANTFQLERPDVETTQYVAQLEKTLAQTRENLHATVEELETTNEEQQATNEELVSSNEELQSTNEELQSVNEEMHTVNTEYQDKIQELVQLNGDLDNLLNNINVGVVYLDTHFAVRKFTPAAAVAFNLVSTDIGRPLYHLAHHLVTYEGGTHEGIARESTALNLLEFLSPVQEQMQRTSCEVRHDESGVDLLMQAYPYLSESQVQEGVILTLIDISDSKQTQRQLRSTEMKLLQTNEQLEQQVKARTAALAASQQMLSSVVQANPSIIYIYDLVEHRNIYTNDFVERILGYSPAEIQSMGDRLGEHLFHPDEMAELAARHDAIRDSVAKQASTEQASNSEKSAAEDTHQENTGREKTHRDRIITDGDVWDIEYRLRNASGGWQWFYGRETVFNRAADGRPKQILGCAVDISDRKLAEMERQQSEARYRRLYENTPVMMHSIDSTGTLISVSDLWLKTMGYAPSEVIGRSPTDFLTAASQQHAEEEIIPTYLKTGSCSEVPYQMVKKNGEIIDVLLSATMERDNTGAFVRSLAVIEDVTARKQAEAELNRHRAHLEEMVVARTVALRKTNEQLMQEARDRQHAQAQLAQRAKALERSNADLEQFAYVISHDLQEPLRAMTVFSQLLSQRYAHQLDGTASGYINHIVEGGIRMQALIDGILAFSRATYSRCGFAETDLHKALDTALQNLQTALEETQAEVIANNLPKVSADASQITQLFQNLISNAVKFRSEAPPRIIISAEKQTPAQQPAHWLISVQDNGIGIPAEQQRRIFDLFQRLNVHPDQSGYGIGLAICKKIVQRHNGTLSVTSVPEQGTRFFFTLPIEETS